MHTIRYTTWSATPALAFLMLAIPGCGQDGATPGDDETPELPAGFEYVDEDEEDWGYCGYDFEPPASWDCSAAPQPEVLYDVSDLGLGDEYPKSLVAHQAALYLGVQGGEGKGTYRLDPAGAGAERISEHALAQMVGVGDDLYGIEPAGSTLDRISLTDGSVHEYFLALLLPFHLPSRMKS